MCVCVNCEGASVYVCVCVCVNCEGASVCVCVCVCVYVCVGWVWLNPTYPRLVGVDMDCLCIYDFTVFIVAG